MDHYMIATNNILTGNDATLDAYDSMNKTYDCLRQNSNNHKLASEYVTLTIDTFNLAIECYKCAIEIFKRYNNNIIICTELNNKIKELNNIINHVMYVFSEAIKQITTVEMQSFTIPCTSDNS